MSSKRKRLSPWIHPLVLPHPGRNCLRWGGSHCIFDYTKLAGNEAACPTSGCDIVLSSPYTTVFGLPLTRFGFLAYASMVVFAILGS